MVACVAVPVFYKRFYPEDFHIVGQLVIPFLALVGMGAVLYGNLHPFPAAPYSYFPFVTLLIIGLLVVWAIYLERSAPEKVANAGQIFEVPRETEPLSADLV